MSVSISDHLWLFCVYRPATLHVSSLPIMVCMDHVLGGGLGAHELVRPVPVEADRRRGRFLSMPSSSPKFKQNA